MKNSIPFLCLLFIWGCSNTDVSNVYKLTNSEASYDTILLNKLPNIGDYLFDSIKLTSNGRKLLIDSFCAYFATTIYYKGIAFDLAWDRTGRINYMATSDLKFKTEEDINVNSTLRDIRRIQEVEISKVNDWGYSVKLKSGWRILFCIGKSGTDRTIVNNDKVTRIYKSIYTRQD